MARKISITKEMLINSAFIMVREEGMEHVTARKLAIKAGCSTQPIFRVYQSMEDLYDEVYKLAMLYFADFYDHYEDKSSTPFVNLGMAYIQFAFEEKQLFRLLFMEKKRIDATLFSILNGTTGALSKEITKAKQKGVKDPSGIFMKMWIFIHGAACMMTTGDYDLPMNETKDLLEQVYKSYS